MVLIVAGVFTFFYFAMEIIRSIVSGELGEVMGKERLRERMTKMTQHVIVCGYGRMGRLVCQEFIREKMPFVVVDENAGALADFDEELGVALTGDATSDEVLRRAGIDRARSLVTVMASDATNLFTTMSARLLNATIDIVARVEDTASEAKLYRAGANRVVSAYQIGGSRVAHAVLRPTVFDFIELATKTEHIDLQLEEMKVEPTSPLAGTTVRESHVREELKVIIVAIKKQPGHMVFNPGADEKLEPGDTLVAIGHRDQIDRLSQLAGVPAKPKSPS